MVSVPLSFEEWLWFLSGGCPIIKARLQTQHFGPYFSSFLPHSYGYEAANELKSVLKILDFRFGLYCRTASWQAIV